MSNNNNSKAPAAHILYNSEVKVLCYIMSNNNNNSEAPSTHISYTVAHILYNS